MADAGGQRRACGLEEPAGAAARGRAQAGAQAVLLAGRLLQAVEVAQDVLPFGRDPGLGAAPQELLAQDRGQDGPEDVAADGGVRGMAARPSGAAPCYWRAPARPARLLMAVAGCRKS